MRRRVIWSEFLAHGAQAHEGERGPNVSAKAGKNWNPFFHALWEHCRAKPLAVEDHPWSDIVFKFGGKRGKIFAFLGDPEADEAGVTVKPSPEELGELLGLPFVRRAAYIGRYGWISVSVRDRGSLKLALGLIDDTYNHVAAAARRRGASAEREKVGSRPSKGPSPKGGLRGR
jgi:predicted DNA-binding protein (MmcQ/YjbR family)